MPPRHVAVVGAICAIVGWLVASTLSPPVARLQSRPQERERAEEPAPEVRFTEQLQLRLRHVPPTPSGRRNPFAFAPTARAERTRVADEQPATAVDATGSQPLKLGPAFILSGIGIAGDVRTAILTTTGEDIRIVKINDRVGEFTIVEIADQSVTLARGDERFVLRFP